MASYPEMIWGWSSSSSIRVEDEGARFEQYVWVSNALWEGLQRELGQPVRKADCHSLKMLRVAWVGTRRLKANNVFRAIANVWERLFE